MTPYNRSSARRSLIDTVAFRAVSQISTLLGYIILVRGMTEEDFGVYSLLYAFIPVVSTIASLGLEQVLRRYQPEYLQAGNKIAAAWLVRIIASGRLITNVVVLSAILLAWNYIAPIFDLAPHKQIFTVFSLLILLHFQMSIFQMALASHMLHRYSVGATVGMSVVKLIAYGALFQLNSLTLEAAIFADTLSYGVAYVWMRVAYQKKCGGPEAEGDYKPDATERKRLFRYALFNNFNDASFLLMYSSVDNFFLAAFIGPTAVGIYAFYGRLRFMVTNVLPVRLFGNVIQPLFFSVPVAEADRKLPQYFSFLLNTNLLLQWPALAFSIVYHAEVVQVIFGGKFIEYSWLLPIGMAFGIINNTISDPITFVAQYEEKAGIILLSKLFAIYNVAAMAIMVPAMGVYGAILVAGTAQMMKNAFVWWYVRRRAVWTNGVAALSVSLLLWSASVAACFALKAMIPAPAVVHLFIGMVVVGLASLMHVRSAAISPSDRHIVAALAPGKTAPLLRHLGLLPREAKPLIE